MTEFRADHGGGCGRGSLARSNTNGVIKIGLSKSDQIFKSYRPIAPKPPNVNPGGESAGSAPSDPPSSSTLSFERTSSSKAVSSDVSRGKRSRNRSGAEPLPPTPRRAKRGPAAARPRPVSSSSRAAPAVIGGGTQNAVEHVAPDQSGFQARPSIPTEEAVSYPLKGGVTQAHDGGRRISGFGPFNIGEGTFPTMGSEWSLRPGCLPDACGFPSNVVPVNNEEPAFMDRAAAASTSQPLGTLSLFPATPSHPAVRSEALLHGTSPKQHDPFLSLGIGTYKMLDESQDDNNKLGLFNKSREQGVRLEETRNGFRETERDRSWGRNSSAERQSCGFEGRALQEPRDMCRVSVSCGRGVEDGVGISDVSHLEEHYKARLENCYKSYQSKEEEELLRARQAYNKAQGERNYDKTREAGAPPYLDPHGGQTSECCFNYRIPQGLIRVNSSVGDSIPSVIPQAVRPPVGQIRANSSGGEGIPIVTPQPVRPVESTLTVVRLERMDYSATPITDNLESVKDQLESIQTPSLITDSVNRVNWVNAAYKQMVGQPECPWLASTVGKKTSKDVFQHNRLTGDVMLYCDQQLSQLSATFSCVVNVQWTNDGKQKCSVFPSEVTRIVRDSRDNRLGDMFLWKLYSPTKKGSV